MTTTAARLTKSSLPLITATLLGAVTALACSAESPSTVGMLVNMTETTASGTNSTVQPTPTVSNTSSATATTNTAAPPAMTSAPPKPTMTAPEPTASNTLPPALPTGPTKPPATTTSTSPAASSADDDPPANTMTQPPGTSTAPDGVGGAGSDEPGTDTGDTSSDGEETTEPGGIAEVDPSDGCGKASPQTGSSGSPLMASSHQYYVKLPSNYDENTPYKVMIMFNPTGNPIEWAEQNAGYEKVATDAIRVYPHPSNSGNGWQPNETSFFAALYEAITGNYCVDKARVFAGGESSGGEFSGFLGCEYGDLLRGVAPGAPKQTSWAIDPTKHECKGNPAAVVIWSPKDNVLTQPAGEAFRDFYNTLNECGDTSTPYEGFTDDMSNCEQYEGCMEGSSVFFCQHNDPNYGNTYHGWAGFAAEMTWEVFSAL